MSEPHADPQSTVDEPETPVWLPALGFALFIGAGVAWAVTPPMASATPPPLPPPVVMPAPTPPPPAAQPAAPAPAPTPPASASALRPGGPVPKGVLPGVPGGALPRPLKNRPTAPGSGAPPGGTAP
jgi:hypothetical protein